MILLFVSPAKRGCRQLPAQHGYRSHPAGGRTPARSKRLGDREGRGTVAAQGWHPRWVGSGAMAALLRSSVSSDAASPAIAVGLRPGDAHQQLAESGLWPINHYRILPAKTQRGSV